MKNKFFTIWISLTIILIFILQITISGFTELFILNQLSLQQPWRFITSIFLHGDAGHLLYNLFALVFFGLIFEKLAGSKNFLFLFFFSGIIANLVAINFYTSSLGASGAIFGIIGALTIIKPLMAVFAFGLPMPLFIASIAWTIGNIIQTFVPSNVGTIAHLSGLAIGIISGFLLRKPKNNKKRKIKIPDKYFNAWEDRYMK